MTHCNHGNFPRSRKIIILTGMCGYLFMFGYLAHGQFTISSEAGYNFFRFSQPEDGHYNASYGYPDNGYFIGIGLSETSVPFFQPVLTVRYEHSAFSVQSHWGGLGGGSTAELQYSLGNLILLIKPLFTFGGRLKAFFYPGFYFGYLIHSRLDGTINSWRMGGFPGIYDTIRLAGSASRYYPSSEFGIAPGAGLEYRISDRWSVRFDYTFRFNLTTYNYNWGSLMVKRFNMDFGAGCTYRLHKKK